MSITSIAFTSASESDVRTGLLGFVSFRICNSLLVDGVTVRRTRDNRIVLSWPCRTDGLGRRHPYLRPIDESARRDIESRVFAALGIEQEAPR